MFIKPKWPTKDQYVGFIFYSGSGPTKQIRFRKSLLYTLSGVALIITLFSGTCTFLYFYNRAEYKNTLQIVRDLKQNIFDHTVSHDELFDKVYPDMLELAEKETEKRAIEPAKEKEPITDSTEKTLQPPPTAIPPKEEDLVIRNIQSSIIGKRVNLSFEIHNNKKKGSIEGNLLPLIEIEMSAGTTQLIGHTGKIITSEDSEYLKKEKVIPFRTRNFSSKKLSVSLPKDAKTVRSIRIKVFRGQNETTVEKKLI